MRTSATIVATIFAAAALLLTAATTLSQQKEPSDAQYMAQALSAAPRALAMHATVVRMDKNGKMRTLRKGTNEFTCMVMGRDRMCNDANAMAFFMAAINHTAPPEGLGISYMLAGDHGTSNTVPFAAKKTATNHWIVNSLKGLRRASSLRERCSAQNDNAGQRAAPNARPNRGRQLMSPGSSRATQQNGAGLTKRAFMARVAAL